MNKRHIAAVTVLLAAAVVHQANAVIINVPGDQPTIQAGIDAAMNGDEIVVAPGTYFESIDFLGKPITVRSTDPTDPMVVVNTVIDGTGNFHVVQCVSGEGPNTVLDGFTLTGGNANGDFPDDRGGGMYNDGSSPTVINCSFNGNSAEYGGGMSNRGSTNSFTCPTVTETPDPTLIAPCVAPFFAHAMVAPTTRRQFKRPSTRVLATCASPREFIALPSRS